MKELFYQPKWSSILANLNVSPPYIADFDSASAMLRATAAYLRGEDFPGLGITSPAVEPLFSLVNQLPRPLQEFIYTTGSANEGIPPERLKDTRIEVVAQWMVNQYPLKEYPAVAIGSSSGAMVHLYAALGIPWLPQTFLVPVKHPGLDPDEPKKYLEWGKKYAPAFLEANPEIVLHQMHDPNEDRLTSQGMTYFRVKRLRLGTAFERFIENSLPQGGTIFLVECQNSWPTTQVSERHIFQFGAVGGMNSQEFLYGSERVAEYIQRYHPSQQKWDAPEPDAESPEAEWGFRPELAEDVERFARERGYRVRRIVFDEPAYPSPFVAELYRWWYKQQKILTNRLLIESFVLLEPFWMLQTGSIPFWLTFNKQPSLDWLLDYLKSSQSYNEIYMMLFSHGVESVGLVSIEQWRAVLARAKEKGDFIGVDQDKYPRDFASMIRYYTDLKRTISQRYPLPEPLTLEQLDQFISEQGQQFPVRWLD
uniref:Uncharacterized protein n=2 Tax=Gloeothece TaxID=28070 RepID=E0UBU7_GLOV7|nr:conserved hypothetical protein [Gloeothece verrucosa PCC 7822]